jgi:hypothetical protein
MLLAAGFRVTGISRKRLGGTLPALIFLAADLLRRIRSVAGGRIYGVGDDPRGCSLYEAKTSGRDRARMSAHDAIRPLPSDPVIA